MKLPTDADIIMNGVAAGDGAGGSMAVGDVNHDGAPDVIMGASAADPGRRTDAGESYVLFGPLGAGTFDLSSLADITHNGIDPGDSSGVDVATGDLNGDGAEDLIIGAFHADAGGRTDAREVYVIFGSTPPLGVPIPGLTHWALIGMAFLMAGLTYLLLRWRPIREAS